MKKDNDKDIPFKLFKNFSCFFYSSIMEKATKETLSALGVDEKKTKIAGGFASFITNVAVDLMMGDDDD